MEHQTHAGLYLLNWIQLIDQIHIKIGKNTLWKND
jgi:hypothetical protein